MTINELPGGSYYSSIVTSTIIYIMNFIYKIVSVYLNDFENHRTDSAYKNALIWKGFLFKFVNSYNSLFYIAFAERFGYGVGGETCQTADDPQCIEAMQISLSIIFGTQIIYNNMMEVLYPLWHRYKTNDILGDKKIGDPEKNYYLYKSDDTFGDFDELMVTYGYTSLFVLAFPIAPLLAMISFFLEMKIDCWKLSTMCRRPQPRPSESIGVWYTVLEILNIVSIFTNLVMILFVSNVGSTYWPDDNQRFIVFILLEHCLLAFKFLLSYLIPDQTPDTQLRRKRQEHIQDILINKQIEEHDDPTLQDDESVLKAMSRFGRAADASTYEALHEEAVDFEQHQLLPGDLERRELAGVLFPPDDQMFSRKKLKEMRQRIKPTSHMKMDASVDDVAVDIAA